MRFRIRAWFRDNPGEYLSHEDMCAKFGLTSKQLKKQLAELRQEGTVESKVLVFLNPERAR